MFLLKKIYNFKSKNIFFAFVISFLTYIAFFGNFLQIDYYFWGSDAQYSYIPARVYLYEKIIQEGTFPFWTERMFSGFPIYSDAENGYLNPINVVSILIFGPWLSYKILHLSFYLVGSLSLYTLLKRKNLSLLSFFVSNTIFYFNTFIINHQIHFNIILTFYLLPTAILLADLYLEKPKLKLIFIQSVIISFSILYGHIQSSLIFCLGVGLYYMLMAGRKFFNKYTFYYLFFLGFAILIQTLPMVLPAKELFDTSVRGSKLDLYQGSMYPKMFSFTFLPYLFGEQKDYIGKELHTSFTYTEMYMYMGITSFLLFCFNLLFLKTNKISIFSYLCLWVFLIFFTLGFNKFFDENTPIISSFRHWERTVILLIFGVAFSAGYLIENLKNITFNKIYFKIFYLIGPIVYLLYVNSFVPESKTLQKINELISWANLSLNKNFYTLNFLVVLVFLSFLVLLVSLYLKRTQELLIIKIILSLCIFYDLSYFSRDVLNFRLQNISEYRLPTFPKEQENNRVLNLNYSINGMEHVYFKNWSPLGYSQFLEKEYKIYAQQGGFTELNSAEEYKKAPPVYILKNLGISHLNYFKKNLTYSYETIPYSSLDLLKNKIQARYLKKEEGSITIETYSQEEEVLKLLLKYNTNWEIKINNNQVEYQKNDIFLDFNLPSGKNIITINYIPKPFYYGVKLSIVLLLFFIGLVFLSKKYRVF